MFILLVILIFMQNNYMVVYADTFDTYYARIMYDDVYLYNEPIEVDSYANVMFCLPRTYFVELLGEANNDFYKVNYAQFTGYIKKDSVQTIIGTPITPYLDNISFRVYSEQSCTLRSEPTSLGGSETQVAYIPLYSRNLTYYGTIKGEMYVDGRTDIWYYCKYTSDKDYYGYIYSEFCDGDDLMNMPLNTEEVTYTEAPDFSANTDTNATSLPIEDRTTYIVIAVLTIPALIFVFLMIKGGKIFSRETKKQNKEIKDY